MNMRAILSAAAMLSATGGGGAAAAAETIDISQPALDGALWSESAESVIERLDGSGLEWTSPSRTSARSLSKAQTFGPLPLLESALWVEDGEVQKAGYLIYSRGDTGGLREEEFEQLLRKTRATLDGIFESRPESHSERSTVNLESLVWHENESTFTLEWSTTREVKSRGIPYRAEFLRLIATPPPEEISVVERSLRRLDQRRAGTKVEKEATRRANGDVILEGIPMIDQGPKGYCVVASVERLLRYFEREADQHELAQVANTSAERGTSTKAMLEALEDVSGRLNIRVDTEYRFDAREFERMVQRYNRYAGRNDVQEVVIPRNTAISMLDIYAQMDGGTLRDARTSSKSDLGRFSRDIQRAIDDGVPLLWTVMLGLLPEPDIPQAFGGHMRLIIGYNQRNDEIIYSDSWGAGHEEKRMPVADAWTMTTGLYTLETR